LATVYADAVYYIALLMVDDDLHSRAVEVAASSAGDTVVTADAVLVELLAFVSGLGEHHRDRAVNVVRIAQGR
jgi:hypothetical protein